MIPQYLASTKPQGCIRFATTISLLLLLSFFATSINAFKHETLKNTLELLDYLDHNLKYEYDDIDHRLFATLTTRQENAILYGYAFLNGFNADKKFKNSTGCFDRITNLSFVDYADFKAQKAAATDVLDKTLAYSLYIQKVTNGAWVCNDNFRNILMWLNFKIIQFGDVLDFFSGFLFNILGKSIQLQNCYSNIQKAQANGTTIIVYQQLAKMIDILLDFNPVETARLLSDNDKLILLDQIRNNFAFLLEEDVMQYENDYRSFYQDIMSVWSYKTDLAKPSGIYNLLVGILDGMTILTTTSSTTCKTAVKNGQKGVTDGWDLFMGNKTIFGFVNGIDKVLILPYNFYNINDKCYDSLFDAGIVWQTYTAVTKSSKYISQNLIYNFGLIYNSLKEIILYFTIDPQAKSKTPKQAGFQIGSLLYYFLSKDSTL